MRFKDIENYSAAFAVNKNQYNNCKNLSRSFVTSAQMTNAVNCKNKGNVKTVQGKHS